MDGAHFCGFHSFTRLVTFDSDATLDVIDFESADRVTMYSNQPGVCTHLTLTLVLPIP
jgi:hypothetical protein